MKILKVMYKKGNYLDIFLDDDDFEKYKDSKLRINNSRGKYFVYLESVQNVKYFFLQRLLINVPDRKRVGFLDGNTLNLQKNNLYIVDSSVCKKRYYCENRQKLIDKACKYAQLNKNKIKEYQKKYKEGFRVGRKVNKLRAEKSKIKPKLSIEDKIYRFKFNYAKISARKRNLEFFITFDEYKKIIDNKCFYTGVNLLMESGGGSLDRIDNNKGYTVDNVIPCCGWVNKMRGNYLTVEETRVAVNAILKHREINQGE